MLTDTYNERAPIIVKPSPPIIHIQSGGKPQGGSPTITRGVSGLSAGASYNVMVSGILSSYVYVYADPNFVTYLCSNGTSTGSTVTCNVNAPSSGHLYLQVRNSSSSSSSYSVNVVSGATTVLTSMSLSPSSSTIGATATQQMVAKGYYSDGSSTVLSSGLTWTSSDTAVATVNASGVVTGVAAGTTAIQAKDSASGVVGSTSVTVASPLFNATLAYPAGVP